jgi:hypothetical protein
MNKHLVAAVMGSAMLALFGLTASTYAWTGQTNLLTFGGAVTIPGSVLPAGTYQFKVVEAGGGDIVRIASKDGRTAYFLGFTQTVARPRDDRHTPPIVLGEAPAGSPPPIRIWYPADGDHGHEFVYR